MSESLDLVTALPLGPGWSGILVVPGPSFYTSGCGGQQGCGVGRAVPVSHATALEWADYALNLAPTEGWAQNGGWWPTRSLVVRWYGAQDDPTSLGGQEFYYKANDDGAFDLALPVNKGPHRLSAHWDGFDHVTNFRYKADRYVLPKNSWNEEVAMNFMSSACDDLIANKVSEAPQAQKRTVLRTLLARKDAWLEQERALYELNKGSPCNIHSCHVAGPPGLMGPHAPTRVLDITMLQAATYSPLNDYSYHGSPPSTSDDEIVDTE